MNLAGAVVGSKFPEAGAYIKEVGDTVVHSSRKVISNVTLFADCTMTGVYGVVAKDTVKKSEGWKDVKTASVDTAKGVISGVVYTGKSVGQTVSGVMR
ncbi:hypothetical protein PGH26_03555 [Sporosarcina jeotgali]|uniref:Pre-toxin TG domain-containing protein n=1 Tax=Sporosarcina jeotgali TaxID=3020056 RepID=A0ABZ0L093_9BACL|nr:hypothetical protein [Sporosarcina sp. B2O-1]WOV85017.1 hypothetical protein PGH26_03555 [Sporosarcina sp. B2O-1]